MKTQKTFLIITFSLLFSIASAQTVPAGNTQLSNTHVQLPQQAPVLPYAPVSPQSRNAPQLHHPGPFANSNLSYKVIDAPNSTYGFEVYVDSRLMIRQTNIPGLPKNEGLKTKEQAARVAEIVMQKLRNGDMPPIATTNDLHSAPQSINQSNITK